MNVLLAFPENVFMMQGLSGVLGDGGHSVDTIDSCLCSIQNVENYEAAILHPHNYESCWAAISRLVEANSHLELYILAIGAKEREEGFGNKERIHFITYTNASSFFADPAAYLRRD